MWQCVCVCVCCIGLCVCVCVSVVSMSLASAFCVCVCVLCDCSIDMCVRACVCVCVCVYIYVCGGVEGADRDSTKMSQNCIIIWVDITPPPRLPPTHTYRHTHPLCSNRRPSVAIRGTPSSCVRLCVCVCVCVAYYTLNTSLRRLCTGQLFNGTRTHTHTHTVPTEYSGVYTHTHTHTYVLWNILYPHAQMHKYYMYNTSSKHTHTHTRITSLQPHTHTRTDLFTHLFTPAILYKDVYLTSFQVTVPQMVSGSWLSVSWLQSIISNLITL